MKTFNRRYAANKLLRKWRVFLSDLDEVTRLADSFGSDKGTRDDAHGYARIYQRFFEPLRRQHITFLEIGLHRPESDGRRSSGNAAEGTTDAVATKAPSLQMWRTFFPKAKIFGFDIDDFSAVHLDRCSILRGDMASPSDLKRLMQIINAPIDVVIDDASHASHHQQIALGHIFPHVRPGGMYIIEDLCWQDRYLEPVGVPKTRDLLRRFQAIGVFASPIISAEQSRFVQHSVEKVWLFDSLTTRLNDPTDALAVLIKKKGSAD